MRNDPWRGSEGRDRARALIGRSVTLDGVRGVVVDVGSTRNGYARFVIEWDDERPSWWTRVVAPSAYGFAVDGIGDVTKVTPILCPHGRATSYEVDGARMDDVVPEIEWCDDCERDWERRDLEGRMG